MARRQKKYEELTISDDFMFGKATKDLDLLRELLEIETGRIIRNIRYAENQKTVIATMDGKDVRFDTYVEDDDGSVYDTEVHNRDAADRADELNLPKRSRYYQDMIDINLLESGSTYSKLKECYIIFICTFDPFGEGMYRYTFVNMCREKPDLELNDKCIKIFFNAACESGSNITDGVTQEQKNLLHYVRTGEATDSFTLRLDNKVTEIRANNEWRLEYMKCLTHDQDVYAEGREEGRTEGIEQGASMLAKIISCIREGKSDDDLRKAGYTDNYISLAKSAMGNNPT